VTVSTVDQIKAKLEDLVILLFREESAGVITPQKPFLQKHVEGILVVNAGIIQIVSALNYPNIRRNTFLAWWDALWELPEKMAVELAHLPTLVGLALEIPYSTAQNDKIGRKQYHKWRVTVRYPRTQKGSSMLSK
jgi:hypothetical protein